MNDSPVGCQNRERASPGGEGESFCPCQAKRHLREQVPRIINNVAFADLPHRKMKVGHAIVAIRSGGVYAARRKILERSLPRGRIFHSAQIFWP